jgi:lipoprotein
MKKLQKFYLVFLSVILVLTLTSCNKSTSDSSSTRMQASEEVMTFATILHDAKSLNYETHLYTKYLDKLKNSRTYNFKMFSRRGEIIFEPQVFLERFFRRERNLEDSHGDREEIDKFMLMGGEPHYGRLSVTYYSPSKGVSYSSSTDINGGMTWMSTPDWKYKLVGIYEEKDPEVGHSDEFYNLCKAYADKFTRVEDNQFVFLEFKGDAKDNIDLVSAFRSLIFDNEDFEKERDNITSLDLQLQIVLEKTENGEYKLTPNEAKVVIRTTVENKETKTKMSTIDQYQVYIMGINQVNEIAAPDPVKELMAQGK